MTLIARLEENVIIDCEGQPRDGFSVHLFEEGSDVIVATMNYDHSWNADEAIADALHAQ